MSSQGEIFEVGLYSMLRRSKENLCMLQGMYHGDIRDGEGVMTYPGRIKDEGIWKGSKLMQMKFPISNIHFDPYHVESAGVSARWKKRGPRGPLEVSASCVQCVHQCLIYTTTIRIGNVR